jgi:hypothetical protein
MGSMLGARITSRLMLLPFWKVDWIPCLIGVSALAVLAISIRNGPDPFRKFAAFSAIQLAAALISPQVTMSTPQWEALGTCMTGTRYFLIPMLAWFSALLVISQNGQRGLRYAALILLGVAGIGIVNDWTCPPFQHYEEFMEQARLFDGAPPGTAVTIPINPEGWAMHVTKH